MPRVSTYSKIRADVVRLWRKVSKRHTFAGLFVLLAQIELSRPGMIEAAAAKVFPGVSGEVVALVLAAIVMSGTRVIDARKPKTPRDT